MPDICGSQLAEMLREAAGMLASDWHNDEPLATLEPDEDGLYQTVPRQEESYSGSALVNARGRSVGDRTPGYDDRRQIVFLDARRLRTALQF
jgi:hypothetical protein